MDFGTCDGCDSFMYLEEDSKCPTCLSESEKWLVVYEKHPYLAGFTEIRKEGLSEDEAREFAKGSSYLFARPHTEVYGT